MWAKRLEVGRFIGDWSKVRSKEMEWTRLKLTLEGIEPRRQRKRYCHPGLALPRGYEPRKMAHKCAGIQSLAHTYGMQSEPQMAGP